MKTKINKDKAVELILDEIEKGLTFNDCMAVILSKVQLNERTFADYWKEAQETYRERRKAIEKAKIEQSIEIEKKRTEYNILEKFRCMEIASTIAIASKRDSDRIKALDYLAKVDGHYSPQKIETQGEVTMPQPIIILNK